MSWNPEVWTWFNLRSCHTNNIFEVPADVWQCREHGNNIILIHSGSQIVYIENMYWTGLTDYCTFNLLRNGTNMSSPHNNTVYPGAGSLAQMSLAIYLIKQKHKKEWPLFNNKTTFKVYVYI